MPGDGYGVPSMLPPFNFDPRRADVESVSIEEAPDRNGFEVNRVHVAIRVKERQVVVDLMLWSGGDRPRVVQVTRSLPAARKQGLEDSL